MLNIFNAFASKKKDEKRNTLLNKINDYYKVIKIDDGGGCSIHKALVMSEFIAKLDFKVSADIGVYRGRSLFPQAAAHKLYTSGIVYGIDPYSNEAAVQTDREDIKDFLMEFANSTDFEEIHNSVQEIIIKESLQDNCKIIRKKSSEAISYFKESNITIDLVHIDGNHDTYFVMEDVRNYLPLLSEKAILVLDDVSWDSVKPAVKELEKSMNFIGSFIKDINDFSVYSKGMSNEENKSLSELFNEIISVK